MFTSYAECEIAIQPRQGDAYPFTVQAPGGDARGTLRLPSAAPAYQALAARLAVLDTDEESLAQIGRMLFEALFQGPAKEVLARSQGMLEPDQGLRIKLCIDAAEAEVAALPWELLNDPDQGPLALLDAPIVRYVPQAARVPTLAAELPLKVLLTGAHTPPEIDVERELAEVQEALAELGNHVQVTVEPHLTAAKLQKRLREGFHIWHFVGHGGFGKDGKSGQLAFENAEGQAEPIGGAQLGIMLNRSGVRLVVLHACERARLATDPFRGLAMALVRAQVPALVAMQLTAPEDATCAFAGEFYRALAEGFPIDACVTEGRKAAMSATGLGHPDWGLPVVYSRAPESRLFEAPVPDLAGTIVAVGMAQEPHGVAPNTQVMVNSASGTILNAGRTPAIERLGQVPRAPRALRTFLDREQEQGSLVPELEPGRGAWLRGPSGCGRSALIRQAANSPAARALPDGVVYLADASDLDEPDDVVQRLFKSFYASDTAVHIAPETARTYLGGLKALFIFDRLPLSSDRLVELSDMLAGGTVLVAADGAAPDTLLDLSLGGLPRQEAIGLCSLEAQLAGAPAETTALLDRISTQVADLPLALVLAGRLIRKKLATPDQLAPVLEEMQDEQEPLGRAARLTLQALTDAERAVLAALTRIGGDDADLPALAAVSQVAPADLEPALAQLSELRLVEGGGERYAIATLGLRRVLDRLIAPGPQRNRAAAFFAGAAALHAGDLAWLGREAGNLLAAMKTTLEAGQVAQAGALAKAVQPALVLHGQWGAWGHMIDWAARAAQAGGDRALEAWALHERGTRAGLLGDRATAKQALDQARRLRTKLGDRAGAAASRHNLTYLDLLPALPIFRRPLKPVFRRAAILLVAATVGTGLWIFPRQSDPPAPTPTAIPPSATSGAIGAAPTNTPTPLAATSVPTLPAPTPSPTPTPTSDEGGIAPTATSIPTPTSVSASPTSSPTTPPTLAPPTATPTPDCQVVAAGLNMRAGPGNVYPVRRALTRGTSLIPLARSPGGQWAEVSVRATGARGWVGAGPQLIACNINILDLAPGIVPPTPVPPATDTPVPTETPVPTDLPAPTETALPTETPTNTPEPEQPPRPRPTRVPTPRPTATPPFTPTPTPTPTGTPTLTPTPTDTPTPTLTPTPTDTPTPTTPPVPTCC